MTSGCRFEPARRRPSSVACCSASVSPPSLMTRHARIAHAGGRVSSRRVRRVLDDVLRAQVAAERLADARPPAEVHADHHLWRRPSAADHGARSNASGRPSNTGTPPMAIRSRSSATPAGCTIRRRALPIAAAIRPQLGSRPWTAALTRLLATIERATARASRSSRPPETWAGDQGGRALAVGGLLAGERPGDRLDGLGEAGGRGDPATTWRPFAPDAAPAAPDARRKTVSFVLVSPSTVSWFHVRSTTGRRISCSVAGSTRASVSRTASIVAIRGWIMPTPFAMPGHDHGPPVAVRAAPVGRSPPSADVSVVQICSATAQQGRIRRREAPAPPRRSVRRRLARPAAGCRSCPSTARAVSVGSSPERGHRASPRARPGPVALRSPVAAFAQPLVARIARCPAPARREVRAAQPDRRRGERVGREDRGDARRLAGRGEHARGRACPTA